MIFVSGITIFRHHLSKIFLESEMRLISKSWIPALLILIIIVSCETEQHFNGSFYYSPANAEPGAEITVKYNPDSSNLAGRDNIRMIAYLYNEKLINVVDIPLVNRGNIYSGKIKTNDSTFGVVCKFVSDDELDNNNNDGYVIFLNSTDGNKVAGSLAGFGAALNRWGAYYADLERDREKALKYLVEDFNSHPEIKVKFLNTFFEVVSNTKPEKKDAIIKKELDNLASENPDGEEVLTVLTKWYEKVGDDELSEKYKKELLKKYPSCEVAQELIIKDFKQEKDIDKKIEIAKKFKKLFPASDNVQYLYDLIANAYRDNKEYKKALKFLKDNPNKPSTYRFYSVVKRMLDEKADLVIAVGIADLGINRAEKELNEPGEKKPYYLSEREWLKEREYYLGLNYFGKGKILYNLDQRKEAMIVLQKAAKLTEEKEDEINELYAKTLVENGEYDFAMSKISDFIVAGHGTAHMKTILREAYLNERGTEEGFETFAGKFENAAKEKLILKLKNEMVLETAPLFELDDINGVKVSLADYKGNTVVLDFWATWCGPCLASFPGMKEAVEKYRDDDKVKFLFINAWERVKDKKKNVSEFLSKNEYPFRVLMDEENTVIEKYKVSGIPTKFIIDGEGNIRFKSVGFQGSADNLVEEICTMISLVR